MHQANGGQLVPKKMQPFTYTFHWGESGLRYGSGAKYGSSETNAVIRHQLNQDGFPTAGVSTSPLLERARFYATGGSKNTGYVYKIDRSLLQMHDVKEYAVSHFAAYPSVPEDQEVILVAPGFGILPEAIVVDVLEIV